MHRKRFGVRALLLAAAMLLAACAPAATPAPAEPTVAAPTAAPTSEPPQSASLTIFAAASLTDAFTEIGKDFEAGHPGVTATLNFAGSQDLRTQLQEGAVADVFASANQKEMDTLVADNLVAADSPQPFLTNILQVILPAGNPANLQTLSDLSRPGVKLVLADETVPVGRYSRQALDNLSKDPAFTPEFASQVLANVVSNETNVKQVVTKVQLGEADAGIVYVSDAVAAPELQTIEIPAANNVIAQYPIAELTNAPEPDLAAAFVAHVLSAEGQAILKKWGFTPIAP